MQQRRSLKWIGWIIFSLKIIIMTEIRDWWFWPIIKIILKLECYFFLFRLGSLSVFLIIHFIVCVKILYFGFIIWHALCNLFLFRNIHFFFNVLWIHISFLILTVSMDSERLIRFINVLLFLVRFGRLMHRGFWLAGRRLLQNIHNGSMDIPLKFTWKSFLLFLLISMIFTALLLLFFYYFISFSFKVLHSFIQRISVPECKCKLLCCFHILGKVFGHVLYFLSRFFIFYNFIDFFYVRLFQRIKSEILLR